MMTGLAKVLLAITLTCGSGSVALAAGGGAIVTAGRSKNFDPKGKAPWECTIELPNELRATLPFADGATSRRQIAASSRHRPIGRSSPRRKNVAWDMPSYERLLEGKELDRVVRGG